MWPVAWCCRGLPPRKARMWSCGNTSLLVVASESYRGGATALMPIVWTQGSLGGPAESASARKTEVGHGVCWEDGKIHRHHHCHWPDLLLPTDGCAGVKHLEHAENNNERRKGGRKALEAHRHRHRWPQNIKKNRQDGSTHWTHWPGWPDRDPNFIWNPTHPTEPDKLDCQFASAY
jgi:hypothetical protein